MANVHRIRTDLGANPKAVKSYPVASDQGVDIGDLMWWDSEQNVARPISHARAWEADEASSRRKVARKFLGVATSGKVSTDTAVTSVRIAGRGVVEFPVGTATQFEVGELVAGDKASGNTLLAQSVERTTDPQEALGRVTERHTATSSVVKFEFVGRIERAGYEDDYYEIEANYGGAYANDTLPLGMVRRPGEVVEALFTSHTQPTAAASILVDIQKGDGTSLLSAPAVLDRGILTAAGVQVSLPLNATLANKTLNEGESLKVVFTSASGTQGQDWSVVLRVRKNIEE